jgi:hypothetical protein
MKRILAIIAVFQIAAFASMQAMENQTNIEASQGTYKHQSTVKTVNQIVTDIYKNLPGKTEFSVDYVYLNKEKSLYDFILVVKGTDADEGSSYAPIFLSYDDNNELTLIPAQAISDQLKKQIKDQLEKKQLFPSTQLKKEIVKAVTAHLKSANELLHAVQQSKEDGSYDSNDKTNFSNIQVKQIFEKENSAPKKPSSSWLPFIGKTASVIGACAALWYYREAVTHGIVTFIKHGFKGLLFGTR